ncbi:hypothetical protein N3K66_004208 [Trichothecium roseum]|uniref:Uncharacterized protein n=1 Tax=Trichothecium roseum TaxID=47278 RepID=A0ACC0V391_9HYPO|nr:hypothetical protein N3K66_004208 [Trichothecium roseum]
MLQRPGMRPVRQQLRRSHRWLAVSRHLPRRHSSSFVTSSGESTEPLRILFFGSDDFSTASLRGLDGLRAEKPGLIESIDVATLLPKPVGRGLKQVRHPSVVEPAKSFGMPLHQLSSFEHFEMPKGINLIIAVSFGLFIPASVLRQCRYGGLNVHPSLLPDLRGAAPIIRAWLQKDEFYGVTLQTLDENKFDRGRILAQTPRPGLDMRSLGVRDIEGRLADEGALMLARGLARGLHVDHLAGRDDDDAGWKAEDLRRAGRRARYAAKITKAELRVDWEGWAAEDWARRAALGGGVFTWVRSSSSSSGGRKGEEWRRVIFRDAERVPPGDDDAVAGAHHHSIRVRDENGGGERSVRCLTAAGTGDVYFYCGNKGEERVRVGSATVEGKASVAASVALKSCLEKSLTPEGVR